MNFFRSLIGFSSHSDMEESRDDIYVYDVAIPPQVLTEILVRLDVPHDVGYSCALVCRRWHQIISAPGFWISYMKYRSLELPPTSIRTLPSFNIKKACLKRSFGRNLISNPSGENSFRGWTMCENGGDRFKIENPPEGSVNNFLDVEIPVAFVTSYGWCSKYYMIDLWKEGIEAAFLDEFCPPITVSEYYTCRFDCASTYVLKVNLIRDGTDSAPAVPSGTGLMWRQFHPPDDETTSTSIIRARTMEQWAEAQWQKIEHTFADYPKGIRYVKFEHAGKDNQFWAGHYGAKMARASVVVNYGNGQPRHIEEVTELDN